MQLQIQEDRANYATMKSRYKTAAHQQREAAELLEEAFIKPHQLLQNTFGGHTKHHEHLDEPGKPLSGLSTSLHLWLGFMDHLLALQSGLCNIDYYNVGKALLAAQELQLSWTHVVSFSISGEKLKIYRASYQINAWHDTLFADLEKCLLRGHGLESNTIFKIYSFNLYVDRKRRALAVITADRLLKSSVLNMRCRQFSSSCKGTVLPDDRLESLQSTLLPLSGKKLDLNTLEAEQIAERTIKLLLQTEPQIRNIAK